MQGSGALADAQLALDNDELAGSYTPDDIGDFGRERHDLPAQICRRDHERDTPSPQICCDVMFLSLVTRTSNPFSSARVNNSPLVICFQSLG